jgi:hypothetical protein
MISFPIFVYIEKSSVFYLRHSQRNFIFAISNQIIYRMRHIFTLSALTALLSLFSVTASAYDIAVENEGVTIYYNFINDGTELEVTYEEYDNPSTYWYDIVIPDKVTYDGKTYSVTSIGEEAFYDAVRITSITIPGSVTSIGLRAWCGSASLKTATMLGHGV